MKKGSVSLRDEGEAISTIVTSVPNKPTWVRDKCRLFAIKGERRRKLAKKPSLKICKMFSGKSFCFIDDTIGIYYRMNQRKTQLSVTIFLSCQDEYLFILRNKDR